MRRYRSALLSAVLVVALGGTAIADPPRPCRLDVSDVLRIDESVGKPTEPGPIAMLVEWIANNIKAWSAS